MKGTKTQIGTRKETSLFCNPWILREHSFKPLTHMPFGHEHLKVAHVINDEEWNLNELRKWLNEDNIMTVLGILQKKKWYVLNF